MKEENQYKFSYYMFYILAVMVVISPFVIYYFSTRSESLRIFGLLDQTPKLQDRKLPLKKGQKTIRILSLEGGGAKGYVSAKVLDYLEKASGKPIYELFDVILGTTTGAISSVILTTPNETGGAKYSAEDLVNFYQNHLNELYDAPLYHTILTLDGTIGPKYKMGPRYDLINQYIDGVYFDQLLTNVVIPAYNVYESTPEVFYNWDVTGQQDMNFAAIDLVMGSVSPYSIFPHYAFSSKRKRFALADGSMFVKSPDLAAALIAANAYPNRDYVLVALGSELFTNKKTEESPSGDFSLIRGFQSFSSVVNDSVKKFNTYILQEVFPYRVEVYNFAITKDKDLAEKDDLSHSQMKRLVQDADELLAQQSEALQRLVEKLSNTK